MLTAVPSIDVQVIDIVKASKKCYLFQYLNSNIMMSTTYCANNFKSNAAVSYIHLNHVATLTYTIIIVIIRYHNYAVYLHYRYMCLYKTILSSNLD